MLEQLTPILSELEALADHCPKVAGPTSPIPTHLQYTIRTFVTYSQPYCYLHQEMK